MKFEALSLNTVHAVWALFNILKAEHAEVTFADVQSVSELEGWIDNPAHLTYVAIDEESGDVVSVVRGRRDLSEQKKHAAFLTAATHPIYRGKAVAAALTLYALDAMKSHGVTIARIYVYSNNHASLRAVEKLGFTLAGRVEAHHIDGATGESIDDVIFHKYL